MISWLLFTKKLEFQVLHSLDFIIKSVTSILDDTFGNTKGKEETYVLTGEAGKDNFIFKDGLVKAFIESSYIEVENNDYALITGFNKGKDVIELSSMKLLRYIHQRYCSLLNIA